MASAIHIAIHNNVAYGVLPMTYSAVRALVVESTLNHRTVTAEAAGSSPVVPAIPSKAVAQFSIEPSRTRKSEFLPHCGIRTGRRDGRGDRSPNLAVEQKQRYPYAARRIEY